MKKMELDKLERAKDEAVVEHCEAAQELDRVKIRLYMANNHLTATRQKVDETVVAYLKAKLGAK